MFNHKKIQGEKKNKYNVCIAFFEQHSQIWFKEMAIIRSRLFMCMFFNAPLRIFSRMCIP